MRTIMAYVLGTVLLAATLPVNGLDISDEVMAEAREEFDMFDQNRDGYISKAEIRQLDEMADLDEGAVQEAVSEFFGMFDLNKDGKVSVEEMAAGAPHRDPANLHEEAAAQARYNAAPGKTGV
jgi:hypothetical protein|uniref:EF-hand domain-containing protein n=1 Tax=Haptolina ericina TaxID=156174 RepID=A0A7S3AGL6_9EUKA|mmetsp:Transcript_15759/g.35363  ORF Transcript_15759/g.35363 Transcript_15759/m.35363 type:complete len:123 (+) Transcript_15759:91-459(+)